MASKKKALALRKPAARKSPASKTLARKGTAAKTQRRKTAPRKVAPKTPGTARRAPAQTASTRLPVLGEAIGGGFLGAVYFGDDGRRVGLVSTEERRVGHEWVSTCQSWGSPDKYNKKNKD